MIVIKNLELIDTLEILLVAIIQGSDGSRLPN
jgi:hypothetical protein